jgi:hypothetical protein
VGEAKLMGGGGDAMELARGLEGRATVSEARDGHGCTHR